VPRGAQRRREAIDDVTLAQVPVKEQAHAVYDTAP
jgi:hypothetical protein